MRRFPADFQGVLGPALFCCKNVLPAWYKKKMNDYRTYGLANLFLALFLILSGAAGPAFAEERMPVEEVAARVQAVYDGAGDLKAGFTQEATVKSLKKTEKESGTLYFKKPRRMLWA